MKYTGNTYGSNRKELRREIPRWNQAYEPGNPYKGFYLVSGLVFIALIIIAIVIIAYWGDPCLASLAGGCVR